VLRCNAARGKHILQLHIPTFKPKILRKISIQIPFIKYFKNLAPGTNATLPLKKNDSAIYIKSLTKV